MVLPSPTTATCEAQPRATGASSPVQGGRGARAERSATVLDIGDLRPTPTLSLLICDERRGDNGEDCPGFIRADWGATT